MKKLLISLLLANLLAACASPKPNVPIVENKPDLIVQGGKEDTSKKRIDLPPVVTPAVKLDPFNDPKSILAKRSVFYNFDQFVVHDEDKPLVQAHAVYLREHGNQKVRLEGNCDERGSEEYNLALGQKRAESVKKMMIQGGARENQIEAVSKGDTSPAENGHNEASWSQNRRTDINYVR